ncbi:Crp/Fnr family transcriptional regulator [Zavarzinia sp. CC-PAN008]|uniref:Crp/Fnr family transcriptional regulator n=1 Tax=Zavarzinia sp. CC-PAN008 TaxID=3243332 RepID=UPI003F744022
MTFLSGLVASDLAEIEQACRWHRFGAGEQILNRESESRDVFFVVEGKVQVVNFSLSGREIAYGSIASGGYFGELSAIDGEPRSASVVAQTECLLASLAPDLFVSLLMRHPSIALSVIEKMARIIRICDDRIMDLSTLGAHQRVYVELLRLAKPDPLRPDSWMIWPVPTQASIAGLASTTRETVARVIGQLQASGIVQRKHKTLYLRDMDKLRRLSERVSPATGEATAR